MTLGQISLDGKLYPIRIASYRSPDIVDFAPRAATPGGSIIHSELGLYQPLLLTDWRHGMGFAWYSDASGYLRTEGFIDTRQAGIVMLWSNVHASDTDNNRKVGFVTFNGKLYAYGATGLRVNNAGVWSAVAGAGTSINGVLATGSYLFLLMDGARILKMSTAEAVTNAGLDGNAADYKWAAIHGGYIYAGKDGLARIHYSDQSDLNDLEGTDADPDKIEVGAGVYATLGAVSYAGKLYVFRIDGIWMVENKIASRAVDFSDQASSDNFRSWAVYNGLLTFAIRDRVKQWNGTRLTDITPAQISDAFPYTTYGRFANFVTVGDFLYCTARTNEVTYSVDLLSWDGIGWHRLCSLVTDGSSDVSAMNYDVVNNRLWYHVDSGADHSDYIQFQSLSAYPYSDFPTGSGHALITSRLDMGFRRVTKSMSSLLIEASNLTAARTIKVYYSLDGDDWVLWATVTTNGTTELTLPGGLYSVEFVYLQLKFELITDTASQTPVLEGVTVRFIMRPNEAYGHSFEVPLTDYPKYGTLEDPRTANEMRADLRAARASKAPVVYINPYGTSYRVYCSALVETIQEQRIEENPSGAPSFEATMLVNLVEL